MTDLLGPSDTPAGHVPGAGVSDSGSAVSAGGRTTTYQIDQSQTEELLWGPRPAISLDETAPTELVFDSFSEDGLVATWTGTRSLPLADGTFETVHVRFRATILDGTASGWKIAVAQGANGGAIAVADIDDAKLGTFTVNSLYEASYDGIDFQPIQVLYDVAQSPGRLQASVSGDFFWNPSTDTEITSGPLASGTSTTADFVFGSNEDGVTFLVSFDGGEFQTLPGNVFTLGDLALGNHSLTVKAVDGRGFEDATPVTYAWTVVEPGQVITGDQIEGYPHDVLYGGQGADTIWGLTGDDAISGGGESDTIYGGDDNDQIDGGAGDDSLHGDGGDDTFHDYQGRNVVDGGAGNDTFQNVSGGSEANGGGIDSLTGGTGTDTYNLAAYDVYYDATNLTVDVITDFVAGEGGDVLNLNGVLGYLLDYVSGENPFTSGYLVLVQDGADTLVQVDVDGTAGVDYLPVTLVRLLGVEASQLNWANFEPGYSPDNQGRTAEGGNGDDSIEGSWSQDSLAGGEGNDGLYGRFGDDTVRGDGGHDYVYGGGGNDDVQGGAGDDHVYGDEPGYGGGGADVVAGGAGNDYVHGGGGDDILDGGDGDDVLDDTLGANTFYGGAGNDTFNAVETYGYTTGEADTLTGGTGRDTYGLDGYNARYSPDVVAVDVVTDFAPGEGGDVIDLARLISYFDGYGTGENPFLTGHLVLTDDGSGNLLLQMDFDGTAGMDGGAVTILKLLGVTPDQLDFHNFEPSFAPGNQGRTAAGGDGDDILDGTMSQDSLAGGLGDDQVSGYGSDDTLQGDGGRDHLYGGMGNDDIRGGADNDHLQGDDGDDLLSGNDGDDWINGGEGDDILDGGAGNDAFNDTLGSNTFDGGAGDDEFSYLGLGGVTAGADTFTGGTGRDTYWLTGYSAFYTPTDVHVDVITDFAAGEGGDVLNLRDLDDYFLIDGWGSWYWWTDEASGFTNPFLSGHLALTQDGADSLLQVDIDGLAGTDHDIVTLLRLQGVNADDLVWANFDPGYAPDDLGRTVTGGEGNDDLQGTASRDSLDGGGGDDILSGKQGADILSGGLGSDLIYAGGGDDAIHGDDGDDYLYGSAGNDDLHGGDGHDQLAGGQGNDTLSGGAGNDTFHDEAGDDTYDGGAGDDRFHEVGAVDEGIADFGDTYTGGEGQDVFDVSADGLLHPVGDYDVPVITDFQLGQGTDVLDLGDVIGYLVNYDYGQDAFAAGYLRFAADGADTLLLVDIDASGSDVRTLLRLKDVAPGDVTRHNVWPQADSLPAGNNAPPDDIAPSGGSVQENAAHGTLVGTVTGHDPDGDALSYELADDAGGRFAINAATGAITVANGALLDRETSGQHVIQVRATDTSGASHIEELVLSVTDVNEFQVSAVTDANTGANQVNENAATGTVLALKAQAADADATTNAVTYSLDSNAGGAFAIDAATGVVRVAGPIDYEAGASRTITVRATSADGSHKTADFTISVVDRPEVVGAIQDTSALANSVRENSTAGTTVGLTALATDPDGDVVTYALTDSAGGLFAINATTGVVTVAGALDFETAASHTITARATSADGSVATRAFTIQIENQSEAPIGAVSDVNDSANAVNENAVAGSLAGVTAQATDPDGEAVTYALANSAGGLFAIDAATGVVTVAGKIDREVLGASQGITVRATSADGSVATQSFTIALGDVDEFDVTAPTDANAGANQVQENAAVGTLVGVTALATDADATTKTVTYALANSAGGLFAIDAATGVVTVAGKIDAAGGLARSITVRATSTDGSVKDSTFSIGVIDIVDPPTDLSLVGTTVAEFAANDTVVGKLTTVDVDSSTFTYSLVDSAGGLFKVVGDTIRVADRLRLDFEQDSQHDITVKVSDGEGGERTETLTIQLTNVAPEILTGDSRVNTFVGGLGDDALAGAGGNDVLVGAVGNDKLSGGTGNDVLNGGDGGDSLTGGAGTDELRGGVGSDWALYSTAVVVALDGSLTSSGDAIGDTFSSIENLSGSGLADRLRGGGLANSLVGNAGNDRLEGQGGNDVLLGGIGDDILRGGAGSDTLNGGTGLDDFVFVATGDSGLGTAADRIQAFASGDDIVLTTIDANTTLTGNQAFVLDAGGSFAVREIRQTVTNGNLLLEFNTDTDLTAEMSVLLLQRTTKLIATDFDL